MVPSRAASNTKYIDAVGRIVMGGALCCCKSQTVQCSFRPQRAGSTVLRRLSHVRRCVHTEKETERAFADTSQVRKAAIMTRVMGLIHELCKSGIHSTKRDIFYTDVKLFRKQDESDGECQVTLRLQRCGARALPSPLGKIWCRTGSAMRADESCAH